MPQILSSVIKIQGLTKEYNNKIVVDNIDLEISESCFALLGPNGAGKTTTFLMLLGLVKPSKGTAFILGKEISKNLGEIRNKIGFLPENVEFYPNLTGRGFLELIIGLRNSREEKKEIAESFLNWSGLEKDYWNKKIITYSRGMRQRLGLAQAFAGNPKIAFLDEPLSNIDPLGREELINKIREKRKEGIIIIISSHIVLEIEQLADSIAIINKGKIRASNTIFTLAQSFGFKEYEINRVNYKTEISINDLYESLSSEKDLFLDKPKVLSEKLIFRTEVSEEINKIVMKYEDFNFTPISGTLSKIYKKIIKESNYEKRA